MFITICTSAQDIIYKVDGNEIKAKIIEITTDAIKYKNFGQLESPLMNISISDVFMIIYEGGEKEVFKTKGSENMDNQNRNNTGNLIISRNKIYIDIVDSRANKIIGKAPSRGGAAIGLIVQPKATIKDKEGKIYNYAEKKLKNVLKKKGFLNRNNSTCKLEMKIIELYHEAKTGLYGTGGNVTQNCKILISLTNNNKLIFQKNFNSLISEKTKDFTAQVGILNVQYSEISETNNKKQERKKRKKERKEYSSKGHFIDFILVFDDIISQLINDNEFQNIFSE